MIGDLIFDFLTNVLEEMKQPSFQTAPYPLKENLVGLIEGIAFFHTLPGWRSNGTAAAMLDQNDFAKTVADLVGACPETAGAPSGPESGAPGRSPLDEAIESLVACGDVEVVRHEKGKPVYCLTEAGLQRHALKTGRPIEELRALPELNRRAEELWPSLRRDRRTAKGRKGH